MSGKTPITWEKIESEFQDGAALLRWIRACCERLEPDIIRVFNRGKGYEKWFQAELDLYLDDIFGQTERKWISEKEVMTYEGTIQRSDIVVWKSGGASNKNQARHVVELKTKAFNESIADFGKGVTEDLAKVNKTLQPLFKNCATWAIALNVKKVGNENLNLGGSWHAFDVGNNLSIWFRRFAKSPIFT